MGSPAQQRELWIYLSIAWWIGSVAAWLLAWCSPATVQPNHSVLTVTGLLVIIVSACLRLPVLTIQTPTRPIEDHFVWLLAASANVNWIGYLCLHAESLSVVIPSALIGMTVEWWLWNQAQRIDCLVWARPVGPNQSGAKTMLPPPVEVAATFQECNIVQRTLEDGTDATGRRYLAGEVALEWLPDQRNQTIVIGFVPAFTGDPEVELEVDCDQCTARVANCTPVGMRVQLKRTLLNREPFHLSWYAKQAAAVVSADTEQSTRNATSSLA